MFMQMFLNNFSFQALSSTYSVFRTNPAAKGKYYSLYLYYMMEYGLTNVPFVIQQLL